MVGQHGPCGRTADTARKNTRKYTGKPRPCIGLAQRADLPGHEHQPKAKARGNAAQNQQVQAVGHAAHQQAHGRGQGSCCKDFLPAIS